MGSQPRPRRAFLIALIIAAVGLALAYAIETVKIAWVSQYRSTLVSAVWLYLPLPFIIWGRKSPVEYGVSWGTGLRGLVETLLVCVAVLVPFYVIFFTIYSARWNLHVAMPRQVFQLAAAQFLAISLPEEFFFRGYLQTELDGISQRKWRLLGADVGLGWLAASFIFALGHVALLAIPIRAAVFIPALLFGWTRARTGSVLYPAIMHAIFNITFITAQRMVGF